jgi:hypothetical protein
MSDTRANRIAGGPEHVYIAAYGTALPATTGATLTMTSNEVQTITPAGTWTSGTYTLEMTYADASSETTAAIAHDANAATIKSALAALNGLDAADLTVTGGPMNSTGPVVPVVVTFGGTFANTNVAMLQIDVGSIVGGGTATIAETTQGRLWTELPDIVQDVKISPVHKTEDHRPAGAPMRTDSVTVDIGVEKVALMIDESDLDALNTALASTLLVATSPGAGQVGLQTLTQPLPADADAAVYALLIMYRGPQGATGWGILDHYYRVKRLHTETFTAAAGKTRQLGIVFEVMADPNTSWRCHQMLEYTAAATS